MKHHVAMPLHPATALILWLFFAIWLNRAMPAGLLMSSVLLLMMLWMTGWGDFLRYLRRTRVLLLLIWSTGLFAHGMPEQGWSGLDWLPSSIACWRWIALLAALAVVMSSLSRIQLLVGVRGVLYPLRWLGMPVERVAVRLWLTLEYADQLLLSTQDWRQRLHGMMQADDDVQETAGQLVLPAYRFSASDIICMLVGGWFAAGI